MRHLLQCTTGIALLIGCADPDGLPTNQGSGNNAEGPALARAEVIRTSVGVFTTGPGSPLLVLSGYAATMTLADVCGGTPVNSPNSIAHVVLPPSGGFRGSGHGQDVPVLVYEFTGDPCDGVGETLIASGTGHFHLTTQLLPDGTFLGNFGLRGTLDLVAGGQALLVVRAPFHLFPDGSVKFDKTRITLTPL